MGSRFCSKKYGGEDFAIQVKGMEMPAYDPRGSFGQGLAYAVANRGACHVANSVFALEVYMDLIEPLYIQKQGISGEVSGGSAILQ